MFQKMYPTVPVETTGRNDVDKEQATPSITNGATALER